MKEPIRSIIYTIACLLLLIGIAGMMFAQISWMAWLVFLGGLGYSIAHLSLVASRKNASTREKRLHRLSSLAGMLWMAVAVTALNHVDIWALVAFAAVVFMAYSDISLVLIMGKKEREQSGDKPEEK